jgi:hypothetical protein
MPAWRRSDRRRAKSWMFCLGEKGRWRTDETRAEAFGVLCPLCVHFVPLGRHRWL